MSVDIPGEGWYTNNLCFLFSQQEFNSGNRFDKVWRRKSAISQVRKIFLFTKNILICIVLVTGFKHIFWSIIVCVAMGCAAIFLYSNTIDFMNATVVTTVDTMTVPLSEVFFPSVVVCNINQVKTGILFHIFNVEYSNTSNTFSFFPWF